MPYPRSLQAYTPPEFYREFPKAWMRRLRDISADMPNLDHLVPRWFEPTNPDGSDRSWFHPERGQWVLYSAKPIGMVDRERAEQFEKHWSELPVRHEVPEPYCYAEQQARKDLVSDYQHFMWHTRGLYVKPFLILQGEWGGTPAKYTKKEEAILSAMGAMSDPAPIGTFPACPFDERTVEMILGRDRLLQVSGSYEDLEKLDSPLALANEQADADRARREKYLKVFNDMNRPCVEFFQSFLHTKAARELPRAPEGLGDRLAVWREQFIETGRVVGAGVASPRRVTVY